MQDPSVKHSINVSHMSPAHQFGITNRVQSIVTISYFSGNSITHSAGAPALPSDSQIPPTHFQHFAVGDGGNVGAVSLGCQVSGSVFLFFCPHSGQAVTCRLEWELLQGLRSPHGVSVFSSTAAATAFLCSPCSMNMVVKRLFFLPLLFFFTLISRSSNSEGRQTRNPKTLLSSFVV